MGCKLGIQFYTGTNQINKTGEICKDQNTDNMLIYQELEKYLRKYANKYMIMEML